MTRHFIPAQESPEYIAATRGAYEAMESASADKRAAIAAGNKAAYCAAQQRYSDAQDSLYQAELLGGFRAPYGESNNE